MKKTLAEIQKCIELMQQLRNPNSGCPWDLKQDHASLAPYLIEEAQECYDAIQEKEMGAIQEELGDLLLQILFHCQLAAEAKQFTLAEVAQTLSEKLVRRHPHIFGTEEEKKLRDVLTPEEVLKKWNEIKAQEKQAKIKT